MALKTIHWNLFLVPGEPMGTWTLHSTAFSVLRGNLAEETTDAVALGVRESLQPAGPASGAVLGAAGEDLRKHLDGLDSLQLTETVMVPGFDLPASNIVLCSLRPESKVDSPRTFLKRCYQNTLRCAEQEGLGVISLQPLGLGDFGFPIDVVSRTGVESILQHLETSAGFDEIRVVVYDVIEYSSVDNFAEMIVEGPPEGRGNRPSLQF